MGMRDPMSEVGSTTVHYTYVREGYLVLSNEDDGYYHQVFKSNDELESFIKQLRHDAELLWGKQPAETV